MGQEMAPFGKGQLRANVYIESVFFYASIIGLFWAKIIDRARPQSGHPSRPAWVFYVREFSRGKTSSPNNIPLSTRFSRCYLALWHIYVIAIYFLIFNIIIMH